MFGEIGQTITVVNKSGKIVSSSKHLVNVFKEAKAAYRERKAEIRHTRNADHDARHALKRLNLEEHERSSHASSKRSDAPHRSKSTRPPRKPPVERGYTDSFFVNDPPSKNRTTPPPVSYSPADGSPNPHPPKRSNTSPLHYDQDLAYGEDVQRHEMLRRHSDGSTLTTTKHSRRPRSLDDIDMDLAYGELPPPLPPRRMDDEADLRGKVTRLQQLLDEANCLQHSVSATIESLQKNPEALAAVGLALAEVSNLATKMAPGVLTALKGSFPAVFALLASPQFLIAAGLGVGVTVVMLGGYKIIKRLKDKKDIERNGEEPLAFADGELRELEQGGLGRIEGWRRGIAEAEAESVGTTVDGEFITPMAGRRLLEEGALRAEDLKSSKSGGRRKSKDHGKEKERVRRAKSTSSKGSSKNEKEKKKKEPSGLRMLFRSHTTVKD